VRGLLAAGAALIAAVGMTGPAALAAVGGNPLASLTADQVVKRADADLKAATSVHFYGSGTEQGRTVVVSMTIAGQDCSLSDSLGKSGVLRLILIGRTQWFLLTALFLKGFGYTAAQKASLEGKWLKESADSALTACGTKQIFSGGIPGTGWSKGATITISGHPALQLTGVTKKGKASIYVSESVRPEFLRFTADGSRGTFSGYDAPITISPPPASEVVTKLPAPPGL
jgi:hypothetical protein